MVTELEPGMLVGRYRLQRRIATGGMGSVWVAGDERLEREVAIKVLPRMLVTDPSAERRFEREARAMGRLRHPNVVTVFDVGSADPGSGEQLPFLVMELLEGTSLDRILAEGPLPPERAVEIFSQVAEALAAAHAAGIVHRDLKPSNIMVADDGHVKVLDFGLARLTHSGGRPPEDTLTTPGMVLGSCPYMAPEQALGQEVLPASDVFSFGSVLYEALSGQRAYRGATPLQVLQAVVKCEFTPLDEVAPGIEEPLVELVERCMSRSPEHRFASGTELAQEMGSVRRRCPPEVTDAPTVEVRSSTLGTRRMRRRRAVVAGAAACIAGLVLGLLGGVWWAASRETRRLDVGAWDVRDLLSVSGALYHPAWNPSGDELAVELDSGGRSQVLLVPMDGAEPRVLLRAEPGQNLYLPRFSPDGRALSVTVAGGEEQAIRIYPSVGGRELVNLPNAEQGTWRDSDRLLFSRFEGDGAGLWEYHKSTGEERMVLAPEAGRWWWRAEPAPDGRLAVLGGPSDVQSGLYVFPDLDSTPNEWMAPGRRVTGFGWSPDGAWLVASVDGTLTRIGEDEMRPLLPPVDALWAPAFSPDGTRLAAVRRWSRNDLVAVDPDGGDWLCELCSVPDASWGSLGPEGSIAYGRRVGGRLQLMLRSPEGSERRLTGIGEEGSCPAFAPDGERIAYLAQEPGRPVELRVMALSGGRAVTLASGVEASEYPSWSADGRHLAYAAGSPIRVFTVSAAGGQPRELTPDGGDYPRWSPDGRWVAYVIWTDVSDPDQGAWVVPSDGGSPRQVSAHPTQLGWSPDGGLLWQLRRSGDQLELWEAATGDWTWRRRSTLDLGGTPAPYMEHLPFTVDPSSGRLVLNRRMFNSTLVLFSGLEPRRWR